MSIRFYTVMVMLTILSKTLAIFNNSGSRSVSGRSLGTTVKNMCSEGEKILEKKLPPPLSEDRHKGQAGRIGIFGGSLEYTGAPYFAAISSLKIGADLVYIFCNKEAGVVIKSYSPELIVLPVLDDPDAKQKIEPWLERFHVVLIGPGLGRLPATFEVIEDVIESCRNKKIPMVIDADGLFLVSQKPNILKNYPAPVILTPNVMEFSRLVGPNGDGTRLERSKLFLDSLGENKITFLCKDHEDEIISKTQHYKVCGGGSGRRCGGQGDLLSGAVSTFFAWAIMKNEDPAVACYLASRMTRDCNERAFAKYKRSMTVTDMIKEIHDVFEEKMELK